MSRTIEDLRQKQGLPLSTKVLLTQSRIRQWLNEYGEYEPNAPYLDMSSLPVTVTLDLADIDWCALIRSTFGSLKKYTMMARRAAKKAARLKRKEFYLWRIREATRNAKVFGFGICKKKLRLPKWKWSYTIEQIRRF